MMKLATTGAAILALMVGACGTQQDERISGGAAAGAATGAGIGALAGPPGMLAGAAIGGAAGGVTGGATEPETLNLGEPPWSNPETRLPGDDRRARGSYATQASGQRARSSERVQNLQRELAQRGHDPGPIDGIYGRQTANAVSEFQRANNLRPTGQMNAETMQALNMSGGSGQATGSPAMGSGSMGGGRTSTEMGSQQPGMESQGRSGMPPGGTPR